MGMGLLPAERSLWRTPRVSVSISTARMGILNLFPLPSTWFSDLNSLPTSPVVSSITLRGGSRLDAVSFTLSTGLTLSHGGTGGTAVTLKLNSGESITSAKLCWDKYSDTTRNFYALLTTSSGRTVTTGVTTSSCGTATAPSGYAIVGMRGQSGDEMDQLGWIYAKKA
jgi:hypothetical protein